MIKGLKVTLVVNQLRRLQTVKPIFLFFKWFKNRIVLFKKTKLIIFDGHFLSFNKFIERTTSLADINRQLMNETFFTIYLLHRDLVKPCIIYLCWPASTGQQCVVYVVVFRLCYLIGTKQLLVASFSSVCTKYMWAGSTVNEAGQLGGVRASNHAGFGLGETSAATSYPAAGANLPRPPSLPPPAPPPPAMPYPWDHHHLRHHEEVAVSCIPHCLNYLGSLDLLPFLSSCTKVVSSAMSSWFQCVPHDTVTVHLHKLSTPYAVTQCWSFHLLLLLMFHCQMFRINMWESQ